MARSLFSRRSLISAKLAEDILIGFLPKYRMIPALFVMLRDTIRRVQGVPQSVTVQRDIVTLVMRSKSVMTLVSFREQKGKVVLAGVRSIRLSATGGMFSSN